MIGGTGMSVFKKYCVLFDKTWRTASKRKKVLIFLLIYLALFSVTFCLSYSPFIAEGKSFIWNPDGRRQGYPTLVYIGRYWRNYVRSILEGQFIIPLFDLNIGMGENIVSALNWGGFTDPLNILAVIFPTKFIEYLYNFLMVLRLLLSGLSFIALCIHHKKRLDYAVIGSLIYVFCGYSIYSAIRLVQFINPMIQFPLLLIGIDDIARNKKPYIFVFSVFYSAICGFYFLYMMTIALGVYGICFFVKSFIAEKEGLPWKSVFRIVWNYVLGIFLSGVVFFPLVYGYLTSVRSSNVIKRSLFNYGWHWSQILRFVAPASSWNKLAMAAITFLAVVLLFYKKNDKRQNLRVYFVVSLLFYFVPLGGYIMNGFGYPSNRWTFIFCFLLSYITVEMLPHLTQMSIRERGVCFFFVMLYIVLAFFIQRIRKIEYVTIGAGMLLLALLGLTLFPIGDFKINKRNIFSKHLSSIMCLCIVMINVSVNAIYSFANDKANFIAAFSEAGYETEHLEKRLERNAESFIINNLAVSGRIDSSDSNYNTGMVWHIPTLVYNWSIIQQNSAKYWEKLEGIGQWGLSSLSDTDQRTIANTLLSVRYQIENNEKEQYVPFGYYQIKENEDNTKTFENQYALPWGYTYEKYGLYKDVIDLNGVETQEIMLQEILLDKPLLDFSQGTTQTTLKKIPYRFENMNTVEFTDHYLQVKKKNGFLTLNCKIPACTEGYLRLKGLDINDSNQIQFDLIVDCEDITKSARVTSSQFDWYYGRNNYLFNLGYSDNERTTCTITFPEKGTFKLEDIELYAQPMDQYPAQVEELRKEPLENVVFSPNKITGTIDLSANKILCLSVPYSKGWSAKVDGKPVEILKGNYMFMALPLNAGYHEIEFTYWSPGLTLGIISTVFGVGALIYMLMIDKRKNKQQKIKE